MTFIVVIFFFFVLSPLSLAALFNWSWDLGREFEINDTGMKCDHGQTRIFTIKIDGYEGRLALERLVDLEKFRLNAFEFVRIPADFVFHDLWRVGGADEVVLWWLRII